MKHPPHLHTIVISFGPAIPAFQQHFTDATKAKRYILELKNRMTKTSGKCIESLQLWHQNKLIASYYPGPPITVWLPPPDADGVRRIPERGPHRLPSKTPVTAAVGPSKRPKAREIDISQLEI